MTDTRCASCGKTGCPSAADPVTGPMRLHNAAAYAALLRRQAERKAA